MWPFGKSVVERVREALDQYPTARDLPVVINEAGGTVTFQGEVPTQAHKNLLGLVASGIKGVKNADVSGVSVSARVSSEQQVAAKEVEEQVETSKLAKAVLHNLEANSELKDDPIDVLQTRRSIILRGAVDSQHEHNLAVKIAEGTAGVASVNADDLKVAENAKAQYQAEAKKAPVNIPDAWHTVAAGDTLSAISKKYYGDASKYTVIAKANGIKNPDLIKVGQKLQIPR